MNIDFYFIYVHAGTVKLVSGGQLAELGITCLGDRASLRSLRTQSSRSKPSSSSVSTSLSFRKNIGYCYSHVMVEC